MFRLMQSVIKKMTNFTIKKSAQELQLIQTPESELSEPIETIELGSITAPVSAPVPAPAIHVPSCVPTSTHLHAQHVPVLDDYKYDYETVVLDNWKNAAKYDIVPLISMIRQLCFFTECKKTTIRIYTTHKDDIARIILKIKRRPALQIDVSDMDMHDRTQMFQLYIRLRNMIGMFRVNEFMVRVEHAFDNPQIRSEHFVVSCLMKYDAKHDIVVSNGIDAVHHIVLPMHVHLNSICKIPANVRTLFHHISYSIQPIVFHSQTLEAWFKHATPTNAQIMKLCVQMAEALVYLHASDIVHGDIKPGNTLIKSIYEYADDTHYGHSGHWTQSVAGSSNSENASLSLYLIDFGMSGRAGFGDGTGGTKPFCAPETGNGFNLAIDMDTYTWTKIQKCHDVWSFALMFFTMIILRKLYVFPKDYPPDFFEVGRNGHINPEYFERLHDEPTRELFQRALSPCEQRITSAEFLTIANDIQLRAT